MPLSEQAEKLIENHPRMYHMAEKGSWKSIKEIGLLSTSALLDHYQIEGNERFRIESCHRPACVDISNDQGNKAVIRDQIPMPAELLARALEANNITPQEWYEFLNKKVFFWGYEERLLRLLNGRQYRNKEHDVLTLDTRSFVEAYADQIELCHMNSGNTRPYPHIRGYDIFKPIEEYEEILKGRKKTEAAVEITVPYSVPDVVRYVIKAERRRGDELLENLYQA